MTGSPVPAFDGRSLGGARLAGVSLDFPAPRQETRFERNLVLDNVDLEIEPGEFCCLIGPSGCGKTTILNLFAGFIRPTRGTVTVKGAEVTRPGPDRPVVFQSQTLFPWLPVLQNVTLGSRKRRQRTGDYLPRARGLLERFGLAEFERYYPHQISGGMQQRVQIARALMGEPELLLMDEPFGALDSQTRLSMQEHLIEHREAIPCSVLFITHDIDEAIFLGDTVVVMSRAPGRIVLRRQVALPSRGLAALASSEFAEAKKELLDQLLGPATGGAEPDQQEG